MSTNTRKVQYGWQYEGDKLVKHPAQQKIIKEIFELKAQHMSHTMIARELQERGVPTQRGGTWRSNTIDKIVASNATPLSEAKPQRKPLPFPDSAEQVEKDGGVWLEEDRFDPETGAHTTRGHWVDARHWREGQEQVKAYLALRAADLLKYGYKFYEPGMSRSLPWSVTLANGHGINEIVREMTEATGRDLHALIQQIKDQPGIKGPITRDVNRLLYEVAVQRQTNLALRQELERYQKRDRERERTQHTPEGQI